MIIIKIITINNTDNNNNNILSHHFKIAKKLIFMTRVNKR